MCSLWQWLGLQADLTFGQLANVQTVGIGLYLALGVIQAVSTTGVAGLVRRVNTLRAAVASSKSKTEAANVRRLIGEVSGLEIAFHDLNRRLLALVFFLFSIGIVYFAYCTIWQNVDALHSGVAFIIFYYLVLPVVIFIGSGIFIRRRCRVVAKKVYEAQRRIQATLLDL